ncbi:cytochrome c [Pedobacter sp. JY14-1]|uniref:c-type cytochrome n=1 Tax=Pedobacter sp. JY14-1 TaxID=3034151 RepID=UPI0023E193C1|nr:cytochrome c [Pedobacter sp. JY14-1]
MTLQNRIIPFVVLAIGTIWSCQNADQLRQDMYYVNGRDLYKKHCQNCHGISGEGLENLVPPLTDTAFLKTNKYRLACFIKYGIEGDTIRVAGRTYDGKMPANEKIANIDIAQLIVYLTNSFGNSHGMYTAEQVAVDLEGCNKGR